MLHAGRRALKLCLLVASLICSSPLQAQTVIASQYGGSDGLCGSRTANGEHVNCSAMTAAHKTFPFGTMVRVTRGGRSVIVRINDRGPYIKGRSIDLTPAAARAIGLPGLGTVEIERLN